MVSSVLACRLTLIRPPSVKGESDPERGSRAAAWEWGGRWIEMARSDFISRLRVADRSLHQTLIEARSSGHGCCLGQTSRAGISLRGLETHLFPRSGRFKRASCGSDGTTLSYFTARVRGRAAVTSAPIAEYVVEQERMSNHAGGTRVRSQDAGGARSMPQKIRASRRLCPLGGPVRRRAHPFPSLFKRP